MRVCGPRVNLGTAFILLCCCTTLEGMAYAYEDGKTAALTRLGIKTAVETVMLDLKAVHTVQSGDLHLVLGDDGDEHEGLFYFTPDGKRVSEVVLHRGPRHRDGRQQYEVRGMTVHPDFRGQGRAAHMWNDIRKAYANSHIYAVPDPYKDKAKTTEELQKAYMRYGFKPVKGEAYMHLAPTK